MPDKSTPLPRRKRQSADSGAQEGAPSEAPEWGRTGPAKKQPRAQLAPGAKALNRVLNARRLLDCGAGGKPKVQRASNRYICRGTIRRHASF